MKENKISVLINKKAAEVFLFTLNPENTPKWVPSIVEEIAEEFPPKVGTKYKNRGATSDWDWYVISELTTDKSFTMADLDANYHVRYTLTPQGSDSVMLEYYEWMENGELKSPFTQEPLELLKQVMESI